LSSGTYEAVYDGTSFKLQGSVAPSQIVSSKQIQSITASVASNALTVSLLPANIDFRSSTLSSGTVTTRVIGSTISVVVPTSATLGSINGILSRIAVLAIDNAGTVEVAVVNTQGGIDLSETGLVSTTAISASATASNVVYSTTARTNVAYRLMGYVESTQATAGTWASAPTDIQGVGGAVNLSAPIFSGTSLATDVPLNVGQTITYDITAQTSYALHIATGDNQLYELSLEIQGSATGSAGTCFLNPNNNTFANFFRFDVTATSGAAVSAGGGYQSAFVLAYNQEVRGADCKISTKTISKWVRGSAYGLVNSPTSYMSMHATHWQAAASSVGVGDTTTAWTSLGTITFPVAATGRIIVRRLA
jgi:hypothetical protein